MSSIFLSCLFAHSRYFTFSPLTNFITFLLPSPLYLRPLSSLFRHHLLTIFSGDARSGNGGDASGHAYDPFQSESHHSSSKGSKSNNNKTPKKSSSTPKKSGGNSNNGINLNVLDHLFNDNYFDQKCSEKGWTKSKPKVTAKTSSHSTGGNNYGGTGTGNGGSAVSTQTLVRVELLTVDATLAFERNVLTSFPFPSSLFSSPFRTLEMLLEEMVEMLSSLKVK